MDIFPPSSREFLSDLVAVIHCCVCFLHTGLITSSGRFVKLCAFKGSKRELKQLGTKMVIQNKTLVLWDWKSKTFPGDNLNIWSFKFPMTYKVNIYIFHPSTKKRVQKVDDGKNRLKTETGVYLQSYPAASGHLQSRPFFKRQPAGEQWVRQECRGWQACRPHNAEVIAFPERFRTTSDYKHPTEPRGNQILSIKSFDIKLLQHGADFSRDNKLPSRTFIVKRKQKGKKLWLLWFSLLGISFKI